MIRPQGKALVCPRDGQRGCAYVDAIDPTDAKFKATPAMQQVMDERQRRRKQKRPKGAAKAARAPESKGDDIAQLVASVKRKAR